MVAHLVVGALRDRLDDVINGVVVDRPERPQGEESAPVRTFLESVAVTGFRGIGPTCKLDLRPGPGLTLVVGRNGSGKSSFAEALEFAMTGDSLRWAGKSLDWKNGWRNLHAQDDPAIAVELRVDGERQPRTVRVDWSSAKLESAKTAVTVPGYGRQDLDSLGWSDAVKTFRPFLPYKELSTISEGRPIDRYNALAPMLGMEALQAPIENLRQARLSAERQRTEAEEHVSQVTDLLRESPDERASTAMEALSGAWDLERIEALVTGTDPASAQREGLLATLEQLPSPDLDRVAVAASDLREAAERQQALRGSDAERAERLAGLLEAAVDMHEQHGDADCPVCGRDNGLHSERVADLRGEIERLRSEAGDVLDAGRAMLRAQGSAREAIGTMPPVLSAAVATDIGVDVSAPVAAWQAWIDAPDAPIDLAAHLESVCLQVQDATDTVRAAAATRRRRLADQWRPMAESLAEVLPIAHQGLSAAQRVTPLRSAENWLKRCEATIRDERFDSVKAQVADVWEALAVGSNVTLEDVRLGNKKVVMDVTVDGDSSVALGVMSQGELHALALSLFIPRVKFEASPFGFAILDDPVQAMDPVRVDGLARVLHSLAQTRQVVVFTHDDRLPTAVRRLQIPATILLVTRRPKSLVELKTSLDPLQAAIEDARAVELSGGLPEEVSRRVVPNLCRQAIEVACLESGRRRLLRIGMGLDECEARWTDAPKLLPRVAIALYGDAERAGDVYGTLNNKFGPWAADTARACNEMAHSGAPKGADLKELINRAESLAKELAAL
ncbi:MAG: AAA family ATPase [Acidimicrobiaceae bacterium]|nr:AAA family ATPase [Acidimicrobiaceae bacterium]